MIGGCISDWVNRSVPSGKRESYAHLAADRLYTIKEGAGFEKSEAFKRMARPG